MSPEYNSKGQFGLLDPPPIPGVEKKQKSLIDITPDYGKIIIALNLLNESLREAFLLIKPVLIVAAELRAEKIELKEEMERSNKKLRQDITVLLENRIEYCEMN